MIFPSLSSFGFPEVSSDVVTMISRVRPIHKGASDFVLVNSVPSAKVTLYIFLPFAFSPVSSTEFTTPLMYSTFFVLSSSVMSSRD